MYVDPFTSVSEMTSQQAVFGDNKDADQVVTFVTADGYPGVALWWDLADALHPGYGAWDVKVWVGLDPRLVHD